MEKSGMSKLNQRLLYATLIFSTIAFILRIVLMIVRIKK